MRKIARIARREYKEGIRSRAFIIGLLFGPIFMGGSVIVFALFKDRVDTADKKIVIVDRSAIAADRLVDAAEIRNQTEIFDAETGDKIKPAVTVEKATADDTDPDLQRVELSNRIRQGEIHAFIEVDAGILHPGQQQSAAGIRYYGKNPALDELRRWSESAINSKLREMRLEEAGVSKEAAQDIFLWTKAEPLGLVVQDRGSGQVQKAERQNELEAILLPLAMPTVMFLLIMMGATPQLQSVTEEKSQRIAEVMLGSATPFEFMFGKLVGGVCLSLTAAVVYVTTAVVALQQMDLNEYLPYDLLPWFFVYLIMAIFMFGALFAAIGSACNDASEVQSMAMPAMLPVIFPMFVQMPVVSQPDSLLARSLSLFPTCTPMLMLIRQGTPGGVEWWEPWLGLVGVLLTTLLFVWIGSRVFRVGILSQGTPPKITNIIRWAVGRNPLGSR